jgi:hypothetical protein
LLALSKTEVLARHPGGVHEPDRNGTRQPLPWHPSVITSRNDRALAAFTRSVIRQNHALQSGN